MLDYKLIYLVKIMFLCPTCNKQFQFEDEIVKHYLSCWKQKYPQHKSKNAINKGEITNRIVSEEITNFFKTFQKE